jgi:hypothetical protein
MSHAATTAALPLPAVNMETLAYCSAALANFALRQQLGNCRSASSHQTTPATHTQPAAAAPLGKG